MKKAITIKIISAILWVCIGLSIYFFKNFDIRFVFGIITMTAVTLLLGLKKNQSALTILFFALNLSLFDVILFSRAFSIKFGVISLIPLALLIPLTILCRNELLDLKDLWFEVDPIEVKKSRENKIAIFKREFQNVPSDELINKIENNKLVDEAKVAIEMILKERNLTDKYIT